MNFSDLSEARIFGAEYRKRWFTLLVIASILVVAFTGFNAFKKQQFNSLKNDATLIHSSVMIVDYETSSGNLLDLLPGDRYCPVYEYAPASDPGARKQYTDKNACSSKKQDIGSYVTAIHNADFTEAHLEEDQGAKLNARVSLGTMLLVLLGGIWIALIVRQQLAKRRHKAEEEGIRAYQERLAQSGPTDRRVGAAVSSGSAGGVGFSSVVRAPINAPINQADAEPLPVIGGSWETKGKKTHKHKPTRANRGQSTLKRRG